MLINTKLGKFQLNELMQFLVTRKLTIDHFRLPNNYFNIELINIHVPNINHTKYVHLLYYLILYPEYLSLVTQFCENNLIKIEDVSIQPDNIIDPINYCHPIFIKILSTYGFTCNLNTTRNKFLEGVLLHSTIKSLIAHHIIIPETFFSKISYDDYLNHMIISIMAAAKSISADRQKIIIEQYMLGLALLFKYSANIFTTSHLNKVLSCKNKEVVQRVLRYIQLNPSKFDIIYDNICLDSEFVTEDIRNIVQSLIKFI